MIAKLLLQNLIWIAAMGALLLVPAGTLHGPAAWVFLGTIAVLGISGGLWLTKTDPALLDQRMRSRACRAMLITRRGCAIVCCRGFREAYTADDAVTERMRTDAQQQDLYRRLPLRHGALRMHHRSCCRDLVQLLDLHQEGPAFQFPSAD